MGEGTPTQDSLRIPVLKLWIILEAAIRDLIFLGGKFHLSHKMLALK